MKIAILSDAHGNDVYFKKCLEDKYFLEGEAVFFLGDCFGYLRQGNYILSVLRNMNAKILLGNHEAMMLGKLSYSKSNESIYGLENDLRSIEKDNLEYIKKLTSKIEIEYEGKKLLFIHGKPEEPLTGYLYEDDEEYNWNGMDYDVVFMGHTHYPYVKKVNNTIYVNVGSCGLPRDRGNAPSYVIYDTQTYQVSVHRVLINREEMKEIGLENVHPNVIECLMRKGKINEKN